MATLVGEDGLGGYDRGPRRMRDLEERLKQALERIWGLEDELHALRSRIERVEQVESFEQPRAVA
jgi:predicted  nucleic acid-binding Zn-ribbon protein